MGSNCDVLTLKRTSFSTFFVVGRSNHLPTTSAFFRQIPSVAIYTKKLEINLTAMSRGFESHRLRQVSLLNSTLGSDFFIALQNSEAIFIGISPLFSSSDFRVRYKSYQQTNQKAIHQITQTRAHLFLCLIICIFSIGNSHQNIEVFSHQQISA